MTNQ
jgi:hypothetical protein